MGGWLVLERYITPSLFTVPPCFSPSKASGSTVRCRVGPEDDYPCDQWTLTDAFESKDDARDYLRAHWESFVSEEDIRVSIRAAGVRDFFFLAAPTQKYASVC